MRLLALLLIVGSLWAETEPSEVKIRLTSPLNTSLSRKGDVVAGKILEPEAYRGGYLEGDVLDIRGGSGKRALLEFQFHTLHLAGKSTPVVASVTQVSNSKHQVAVDEDGAAIEQDGGSAAGKISQMGSSVFNRISKKGDKPATGSAVTRLGSKASRLSLAVGSECTVQINTAAKPEQTKRGQ
jgi:hypothetical protein